MAIKFHCQKCGKKFSVKDELAGKHGKCSCGSIIVVPSVTAGAMPIASGSDAVRQDMPQQHEPDCGKQLLVKKKFKAIRPFLKLTHGEEIVWFRTSVTPVPVDSGLSGIIKPKLNLVITNQRLILIASDKKDNIYENSIPIGKITCMESGKKEAVAVELEIVYSEQGEHLLNLRFLLEKPKDMEAATEYVRELTGGFNEPTEYLLNSQKQRLKEEQKRAEGEAKALQKEERQKEIAQRIGKITLNYIGGHPGHIKGYNNGHLEVYDDRFQYVSIGWSEEVLFAVSIADVVNAERYSEGEIKKKYSAGKAIAGGLLLGGLGAVGGFMLGKEKDCRTFFLKLDTKYSGNDCDILFCGEQNKIQEAINLVKSRIVQRKPSSEVAQSPNGSGKSDMANEIRQLAQLRDDGLITENEFDAKKKDILGLNK